MPADGLLRHYAFVLIAAASLLGISAAAADLADAVATPGSGTLTMCRSWLVYESCATYHKVALPERIAVGEEIALAYGSNPKNYQFRVVRIRDHGGRCTILSDASGDREDGERIDIVPCRGAAHPAHEAR